MGCKVFQTNTSVSCIVWKFEKKTGNTNMRLYKAEQHLLAEQSQSVKLNGNKIGF